MNKPEISVVIPAFNASRTLSRALDSVFRQTSAASEVIVVDDGSLDDLAPLQARYSDRVKWIRQSNQGAAAARNNGVSHATGSHVAFLDADDYWESDKLEHQKAIFQENASVRLCCSLCFDEKPGEARMVSPRHIGRSPQFDQVLNLRGPDVFDTACCMMTSSIVIERLTLGNSPFHLGFEPAEDRELWIRLVSNWPVYFTKRPTTTIVLEPGSLSRTKIDRDCGNMLRVVEQYRELLGPKASRWWQARVYRRWAAEYLGSGDPRAAFRPAFNRLRLQPWSAQAWWIVGKAAIGKVRDRSNTVTTMRFSKMG